jgi:cytochrome c oxidase subunit IV
MEHVAGNQAGKHSPSKAMFAWVWISLLVLSLVEVLLTYNQIFTPSRMLAVLLVLSLVKSALIIGYFMHLKFEYGPMRFVLMTALCGCLGLMCVFFLDAMRILELGSK